jgi:predicted DNA-binding transcriptional regulator AlpA
MDNLKFLTDKQVTEMTSLSHPTRWRMRKLGQFPEPFEISPRRKAYTEAQIQNWMKERLEGAA